MSCILFRCSRCDFCCVPDMWTLACRLCNAPLDVEHSDSDFDFSDKEFQIPSHSDRYNCDIWLGEGNTPTVSLNSVGKALGVKRVYGKLEYVNPTGSFKDRGAAVMITAANEYGVKELIEDSSGNAGASVSAYSARAGIKAHIFVPSTISRVKLKQIGYYGAEIHGVDGSRDEVTQSAIEYGETHEMVYASHVLSPYFIEGTKRFAYEVFNTFGRNMPEHILFPVGGGTLYVGAYKGFRELFSAGRISKIPHLHCVQTSAIMPIVAAYDGVDWMSEDASQTSAEGIAVGVPARKNQVLDILSITEGVAVAVEESEIDFWRSKLGSDEGILAEATSVVVFAGVKKLMNKGVISPEDPLLMPITGFGLKDLPHSLGNSRFH